MKKSKSKDKPAGHLSFTGTSPAGDLRQALKDALGQAINAVPGRDKTFSAWTIEEIGGNKLEAEPIFVTVEIHPGEGEGGGTGPKFARGPE